MFSEKARKHADACRFCYMCRHLCPVELVTGKESNTPRAKALLVSMMERGMPMDASCAATMYECLLCGACTADCATGFDPLIFIREARTQAALEGLTPDFAQNVIDRIEASGNPYGARACAVPLEDCPESGETLLWLGSAARHAVPDVAAALISLMRKAGESFAVLREEPPSGSALGDMTGYVEDVRQQALSAAAAIAKSGAKRLVVLDSHDCAFFLHECREWGVSLPETITATRFVADLIAGGRLTPRKQMEIVSYHDAARLARDLQELLPAREILAAMGAEVHEMFLNERFSQHPEASRACGSAVRARECGSTLMGQMLPSLAQQLAAARYADLLRTDARILVSADPQAAEALRLCVPEGVQCRDLFVMLNDRV